MEINVINDIMHNHNSEQESDTAHEVVLCDAQTGGNNSNRPHGGFPPIKLCMGDKMKNKERVNYEDEIAKTSGKIKPLVTIKDMLKKEISIKSIL